MTQKTYSERLTAKTNFIRDEMIRQGISVKVMARKANLQESTIRRLLEGATARPADSTLEKLVDALGYCWVALETLCLHN